MHDIDLFLDFQLHLLLVVYLSQRKNNHLIHDIVSVINVLLHEYAYEVFYNVLIVLMLNEIVHRFLVDIHYSSLP